MLCQSKPVSDPRRGQTASTVTPFPLRDRKQRQRRAQNAVCARLVAYSSGSSRLQSYNTLSLESSCPQGRNDYAYSRSSLHSVFDGIINSILMVRCHMGEQCVSNLPLGGLMATD